MDIIRVKRIFDQLSSTSSKLDKIKIIRDNKDNRTFLFLLDMLLNPEKIFGLSTTKLNKKLSRELTHEGTINIESLFDYLLKHNTGTDVNINYVQNSLRAISRTYDVECAKLIEGIITKKLKIGCDVKLVNTAIPNLLPDFKVMLAEKYFDKSDYVEGKEFTLTTKLDGVRCILMKHKGEVKLYSRQGQRFIGLVDIENEIKKIKSDNFILDGELMICDREKLPSKMQYKETIKIVTKDGEKHGVQLLAFDTMPYAEFERQKTIFSYSERREVLEKLFGNLEYIKVVPVLYKGKDTEKIQEFLLQARNNGEEGIMININSAKYDFKRTKNLLKVKVMQDCDLEIIGFVEGEGKLKGTLGAIIVNYKGNPLNVGGGYSLDDRDYFWYNRNMLMGRIIKVRYFEETQNKEGIKSLRFPVFEELREEGKEESYE